MYPTNSKHRLPPLKAMWTICTAQSAATRPARSFKGGGTGDERMVNLVQDLLILSQLMRSR